MSLNDTITADLQQALKGKQAARLAALRLLQASLQNEQISQGHPLQEAETLAVIRRELKKRREAAELYRQGGRAELADQEQAEAAVLQGYLPAELGQEELAKLVTEAVARLRQEGVALNVGAVMKAVVPQVAGRADGKLVSQLVAAELVKRDQ